VPTRSGIGQLTRRIAKLEAMPRPKRMENPAWMDAEAAEWAAAVLRDLESRLAARFDLPERWGMDKSIPKERVHSAALEMWRLFLTWKESDSAVAALEATERLVVRLPEVEGSRELAARLWPHLEPIRRPERPPA
jgi:hypothetical protein